MLKGFSLRKRRRASAELKKLQDSDDEYLAHLAKEAIKAINTDKPLKK